MDTVGSADKESSGIIKFTIPVKPRTKKNSSQIKFWNGRPILVPSKQYKEFEEKCCLLIPAKYKNLKIDYPVNVKVLYYIDSHRRTDKTNLESAIMDVLVVAGVLADDSAINREIVVSTDGSRVSVDSKNPRVEVEIERYEQWQLKYSKLTTEC